MKLTPEQVAEVRKQVVALLSDTCACGHSKSEDHYHGECEEDGCECVMPDLDTEHETALGLLKTFLAATEPPTDAELEAEARRNPSTHDAIAGATVCVPLRSTPGVSPMSTHDETQASVGEAGR